ncbi:MAG TPA: TetR/AcrR family transcriptional regulator [Candidatus Avipropionibacterium avicola]|uniref:TetR/AcrR family transcriptional regulator n=1 Tax=Candidatus Avipropionibacterium avicola TaxID=2840701 RepID=A0A9D1GZG6_9ACTN|nr:TetR/AcrR family transcriptional regulator [Candidatus Avipropionibacterium avicola]
MSTRSATAAVTTTPRPRPRRTEVRADLLRAAREAFLERGYAGTSVAEIARAAGFTKGAVYSNFGSKEALFAEVCRTEFNTATTDLLADLVETTRRGQRLSPETASRLGALVIDHSALQVATGEFRSLAAANPEVAASYAALRADQITRLTDELGRLALLGPRASTTQYRSLAIALLAMLNTLALEHRAAPELYPGEVVEDTMTFLVEGLLP